LSKLWAILDAYEKDLPFITPECKVTISTSLYPERNVEGEIVYISDLIDEKLRTIKIRVEVDNREGLLKPNMYIQGIIESTIKEEVFSLPEQAIQNLDGKKIVFVRERENVFMAKEVKTGARIGKRRIIREGVDEGEKIVIKGAFNLKAEISKATFGHVHVH
jgi:cobalt-zinc-cadmium efflux system membrane fusion protein